MRFLTLIALIVMLLIPQADHAQINQKNKVFIDGYYGFPNLIGFTLKRKIRSFEEVLNLDVGGNGPYGGKIEYMFHDQIGVSVDVNTSSAYLIFDGIEELDTLGIFYHYEVTRNVLRILPRINFHLLKDDHVDVFLGIGLGYNGSQWTFKTTDPNFNDREFSAIIPVAFRFFVGGRYFFNNFLGLNFELGAGGGGLLQGGISFRI